MPEPFHLNPALDAETLRDSYRRDGRVIIEQFLREEDAWALHEYLRSSGAWTLVLNQGEKLFEIDRPAQQGMTAEARSKLDQAVHAAARYGFQFRFETIRVPDAEEERQADPIC